MSSGYDRNSALINDSNYVFYMRPVQEQAIQHPSKEEGGAYEVLYLAAGLLRVAGSWRRETVLL